jgi:glycosyltransferase involved in cell wall biosynthesis
MRNFVGTGRDFALVNAQGKAVAASPLVSVCIPTYRGVAHLGLAIESVLAQSFRDFELIILDDCSPDNTAAVVAGFADPRIRYLRNEHNQGPQENWNRCLEEARGEYFKLLPQDDLLMPGALAQQIAVLQQDRDTEIALVFCSRHIIGPDGNVLLHRGLSARRTGRLVGLDLVRRCVRRGTNLIGEPGGILFRKQLIDRIGRFDASNPYVLDLDYWFRALTLGDAYYIAAPLAAFRVSKGSWSVAIGARQTADFRNFLSRVAAQPCFGIGALDLACGYCMAAINTILRLLFYRIYLK